MLVVKKTCSSYERITVWCHFAGDLATFFPSAKSEHGAPPQRCLLLASPHSEGASFRVATLAESYHEFLCSREPLKSYDGSTKTHGLVAANGRHDKTSKAPVLNHEKT